MEKEVKRGGITVKTTKLPYTEKKLLIYLKIRLSFTNRSLFRFRQNNTGRTRSK